MAIPALLVEEGQRAGDDAHHARGRALHRPRAPGHHARVKVGFRRRRPHHRDRHVRDLRQRSVRRAGRRAIRRRRTISLAYQPETMRWRGLTVLTNTPPKTSQRAPGGMQGIGIIGADARQGGAEARRRSGRASARSTRRPVKRRSARRCRPGKQALRDQRVRAGKRSTRDATLFKWEEKKALSRRQAGWATRRAASASRSARTPAGRSASTACSSSSRTAASQFQSGIGNLGTHSVFDVHRVAAEMLGVPWDQCDVVFGNTAKNLPWTCISAGSQTVHAMTRAAHAAATDAIRSCRRSRRKRTAAIRTRTRSPAARSPGRRQHDVRAGGAEGDRARRQVRRPRSCRRASTAFTKTSAANLVGQGLMAVGAGRVSARRPVAVVRRRLRAKSKSDTEVGIVKVLDYAAIADVGTILNPRGLKGQLFGGSMLGLGHARSRSAGPTTSTTASPLARRFHSQPSADDSRRAAHVHTATPSAFRIRKRPPASRGVGEPPVGAAYGARSHIKQYVTGTK